MRSPHAIVRSTRALAQSVLLLAPASRSLLLAPASRALLLGPARWALLLAPARRALPLGPARWALLFAPVLLAVDSSAQTWNPETALSAALTVEYFDAAGTPIRSTNGTLVRQGLVVPLTALSGATSARAIARDGKSWTSEQLIAVHPEANLALLPISDIPAYAIDVPRNAAFVKNAEVVLMRGPGGADRRR